ncbi:hypothetical protein DAPPUDRAFT_302443 [Daphnia pulex]|uniref:3-hydroxyanthranilate 3,4-dioxygenase n=1 Tax=Daphnia pulex TaxID=6669 RepID=E9HND5_DAPPU|nr:hypothetical protein DAPPUDRAFT_302443 [Daphnia pulex]|eukprot:EFX66740.1 hypothetical protein DAPPUDRAFT_302443 [Daphnia pulex]
MSIQLCNINQWIEDNKASFLPPVCNKLMHEKQLKVFFVGGPNQRKDFHIEEGEELFYMKKGSMELIVQEQGAFKTVAIQEGQVFLLPGKIPHSPQRKDDTIGLVVERERAKQELDCLRYFVNDSTESLFERWFYCDDLGVQLVPVIKEFFASEQCKTGRPVPGTIPENPHFHPDGQLQLENPFNLKEWLQSHRTEIHQNGKKNLFDGAKYKSDVIIYGKGVDEFKPIQHEIWLWQLEGESVVKLNGQDITLKSDDSLLIPAGEEHQLMRDADSCFLMSVAMPTPNENI